MELKNLQIHFHGKDHLEHRITYVNENGTQCRETLCSGVEFAQYVIDCLEAVPTLRTEREDIHKELCDVVRGDYLSEPVRQTTNRVTGLVEVLRRERDDANTQIGEITKMLVESSMMRRNINSSVQALIEIATAPDATQPQLSEIRYVLHGDIQPCSVLYSDDTTTLLRLDEGDIMCETDTVEWSDSVTYRCQELLRASQGKQHVSVAMVKAVAQLVRDERILLNDNDGEKSDSETCEESQSLSVEPMFSSNAELLLRCASCHFDYSVDMDTCPMCNTDHVKAEER